MKEVANFGITDEKVSTKNSIYCENKDMGIIKEMVSKVDKDAVFAILNFAASFAGGKTTAEIVDKYLDMWAMAKYEFYLMFGRNLKVSKKVEIIQNENAIVDKFNRLFRMERDKNGNDVSRFKVYWKLAKHFTSDEIINNRLDSAEEVVEFLGEYYTPGMKLTRFLSMYFNDTAFDIELSKVYQNKKVYGQDVLSIDPLDYLMSAINHNKWSTCHNMGLGCHADGPLALMLDKSTLICYNSSKDVRDYDFNGDTVRNISMRYRSCVYMNKNDLSFAVGRCYPNCHDEQAYKEFMEFVQEVVSKHTNDDEWCVEVVTKKMDSGDCYGEYELSADRMTRIHNNAKKRYVKNGGCLTFVDPIKYFCAMEEGLKNKIAVGSVSIFCLKCGERIDDMWNKQKAICSKCAGRSDGND